MHESMKADAGLIPEDYLSKTVLILFFIIFKLL